MPLSVEDLLSVSSSLLRMVCVWLTLPLLMWAVLLSVEALVKAPVIWFPLLLEVWLSVSSSALKAIWVWLRLPLTIWAVLLSVEVLVKGR